MPAAQFNNINKIGIKANNIVLYLYIKGKRKGCFIAENCF